MILTSLTFPTNNFLNKLQGKRFQRDQDWGKKKIIKANVQKYKFQQRACKKNKDLLVLLDTT